MALKAFVDPARRKLPQPAASVTGQAVKKPVQSSTGVSPAGSSPFQVIPKRKVQQGVPASALPGTVTNAVPADKPNVARPMPTDLTAVADQMKVAREKGDFGTLAEMTANQYLPALEKMQTSVANVNTAAVSRILGDEKPVPATLDEQRTELAALAKQLQTARETGDLGTANSLAQRYKLLAEAMQKTVTGQPVAAAAAGDGTSPLPKQTAAAAAGEGTAPLPKGTAAAQTATGAPVEAPQPTGGTPGSTVPSGETDTGTPSLPGKPGESTPQTPGTFNAADAWAPTLANPGLTIKTPTGWIPDPAGPQRIQQLIDYDTQFLAGFPPEGQGWASDKIALEKTNFEQAIKQYPDQWEKIFRDHQTRMKQIQADWQDFGQAETKLNEMLATAPPETKVQIDKLPEQQKNELIKAAIEDMKNGIDPLKKMDGYLAKFGADVNLELGQPGYQSTDYKLDEFTPSQGIEIAGPDNVDLNTDKSKIDAALAQSSLSEEGKKALGLQLETIQKRLQEGGGGFSDQELKDMAAPIFEQIDKDTAAQVSAAQHDLAAGGFVGADMTSKLNEIRQTGANKKKEAAMELVKQNMGYKQQGISESITALGDIATSERQAGLGEKELALSGATTQTTLTSKEKEAQASANLAQKALSQEGKLFAWGKKVDENLQAFGFKLDQYKTDKGFDLDRLKMDLDERVAQGELDATAAKLNYQKVKDSIDAAQKETELYDNRTATIAALQQRMAEGDNDAEYRIKALEVQQELSELGLKSDQTKTFANIMYGVTALGKNLSQEDKHFLMQLAATKEAQESGGFMDFIGNVFGSFAGGFAGKAGAAAFMML